MLLFPIVQALFPRGHSDQFEDKKDGLGFVLYIYKIGSLILGPVSYLQLSSCVV